MLFYYVIIFFSTFFTYLYERFTSPTRRNQLIEVLKNKKLSVGLLFYFGAFGVLFIPSAIRYDVGTDYMTYYEWFRGIAIGVDTYFEPGFLYLINLVNAAGLTPQWVFVASSFLILGAVFAATRRMSVIPWLSIFLFSATALYFVSFNIMRQFIAVAILLYAFRYILDRKFLFYAVSVGIASLFHLTALIMLPLYFLLRLKPKRIFYFAAIVFCILLLLLREPVIELLLSLYPVYEGRDDFLNKFIFSEVFIGIGVLTMAIMMYLRKLGRFDMSNTVNRIVFNVVFLSLIGHIFLAWIPAANRILYYLDILYILIIPAVIVKLNDPTTRRVLMASIIILLSLYLYVSLKINGSYDVLPYSTVFSRNVGG